MVFIDNYNLTLLTDISTLSKIFEVLIWNFLTFKKPDMLPDFFALSG